jgi:hypothetical protein
MPHAPSARIERKQQNSGTNIVSRNSGWAKSAKPFPSSYSWQKRSDQQEQVCDDPCQADNDPTFFDSSASDAVVGGALKNEASLLAPGIS